MKTLRATPEILDLIHRLELRDLGRERPAGEDRARQVLGQQALHLGKVEILHIRSGQIPTGQILGAKGGSVRRLSAFRRPCPAHLVVHARWPGQSKSTIGRTLT
jgi:hypothetical protein